MIQLDLGYMTQAN